MLSVNASVEDIDTYPYRQRTSQMNPNMSLTNIFQLNHPKPFRQQLPITPPVLNLLTPTLERKDVFGDRKDAFPGLYTLSPKSENTTTWAKFVPQLNGKVVMLCGAWYGASIVSNNTTKAILSRFAYPVTLTQLQFVLNVVLCVGLFATLCTAPSLTRHFPQGAIPNLHAHNHSLLRFLTPTAFVLSTTLPMGAFQFAGHITSHNATLIIPVSLVHTIKALSPITTVAIYKVFFKAQYSWVTYATLAPLVVGIMLTCYKPRLSLFGDAYLSGLGFAFVSMLIFVLQNIFAKRRLTVSDPQETQQALPSFKKSTLEKKLDKLTILLFCSVTGFIFTMPIYAITEYRSPVFSLTQLLPVLLALVVVNGASHFLQSLLAFQLLGTISPINYSIANIMKRIVVIMFAFAWEGLFAFSGTQSYGIALTVVGLYCYDRWGIPNK